MEIPIRIINGLYKGNSGIIIAFDGEKLVVEFLMLGRNIKANLRPEDTDIPEDDLRQIKAVFNETNKISASPFKPLSTAFGKKIAPAKEILNQHYPIKLPDDFYAFYEFWCELKTNNYYKDFIIIISYGINLYGPFAVLDNPTP